jgi:hypothetical protein
MSLQPPAVKRGALRLCFDSGIQKNGNHPLELEVSHFRMKFLTISSSDNNRHIHCRFHRRFRIHLN